MRKVTMLLTPWPRNHCQARSSLGIPERVSRLSQTTPQCRRDGPTLGSPRVCGACRDAASMAIQPVRWVRQSARTLAPLRGLPWARRRRAPVRPSRAPSSVCSLGEDTKALVQHRHNFLEVASLATGEVFTELEADGGLIEGQVGHALRSTSGHIRVLKRVAGTVQRTK